MSFRIMPTSKHAMYLIKLCRSYSKDVLHRKHVRVLNVPQNIEPIRDENFKPQLITDRIDNNSVGFPRNEQSQITVPPYEKLQKNDARFTKILGTIKNRKLRERSGRILLEGKRLINDAIDASMQLETLYFSREKDLADIKFKDQRNVEILKVLYRTLQVFSDLTTSPGVMGVFKRPTDDDLKVLSEPTIPVSIICDNIREPGNLGSVIRNAAAAGCKNIILLKGCVDPWETKVLRAGCGGHFRIPIINDVEWTHLANYIPKNSTIFVADNLGDIEEECVVTPEFIDYDVGNENNEDVLKYVTLDESNKPVVIDEAYNEPSELEKYEEVPVPCYLYTSVKYPKENLFLYVGGETHGTDPKIVKLVCDYGGKKIKIPLDNGMESLNSSFAMTVILYEIKRQLGEKYVIK